MKKEFKIFLFVVLIIWILLCIVLVLIRIEARGRLPHYHSQSDDGTFSTAFIRESHKSMKKQNYMISPYSVEIALSMLREGSAGDTLKEIEAVAPKRNIKTLSVKNRVNVSNALFVKDIYKQDVRDTYYSLMDEEYNADVIYDSFESPDKINRWVKNETNGMIDKVVDSVSSDFVMALANAVAMEEDWMIPFECERTKSTPFTKVDGKIMNVSMMYNNYEDTVSYYQGDGVEGVILPYQSYYRNTGEKIDDGEQLEFIGLMPDDIDQYIENFDLDEVKNISKNSRMAGSNLEISVGLPRFEYDYSFGKFKETLGNMGIQSVFGAGADLSNMLDNHDAYVNDAVHKTYVKVNETGTKAAAVTYFGVKDTAMPMEEKEYVSVIFNKPFVFMIKDTKSNEILFFGVVYQPEKWNENHSCKGEVK